MPNGTHYSEEEKAEAQKVIRDALEKKTKPMDLETLLDPMYLARRVEHLERVVGRLVHQIKLFDIRDVKGSFPATNLKDIEIDKCNFRLL